MNPVEWKQEIAGNLANVRGRIAAAAERSGRPVKAVGLVVVTKAHPAERVRAAIEAGAGMVGENYVEEGREKQAEVDPGRRVAWHMIGSVQSRKAAAAAESFDMVHSVDRVKLARRMHTYLAEVQKSLPVLVQVNVSGETSKSGFPAWEEPHFDRLLAFFESLSAFDSLEIRGLMSIPPFFKNPEEARPFFARTRHLRDRLQAQLPGLDLSTLSMGMSGDFEVAIEEGATIVRVGTAIMGRRSRS